MQLMNAYLNIGDRPLFIPRYIKLCNRTHFVTTIVIMAARSLALVFAWAITAFVVDIVDAYTFSFDNRCSTRKCVAHSMSSSSISSSSDITYRQGKPSDAFLIRKTLISELTNPLGVEPNRFVIAEHSRDGIVGWGQIKPLGPKITSNKYNAQPGSGSIEDNVDEDVWLEFENDDTVAFPNGFESLPWTKEYRAASEAARRRRQKRELMVGRERMNAGQLWELASIYVLPQYRSQGIGSEVVRQLLKRHEDLGREKSDVYALTLEKTLDWYKNLGMGFALVDKSEEIPSQMSFEISAGNIITGILGEQLVCLRAGQNTKC